MTSKLVDISESWLGRQDSNLGSRDQNPLPYHLATPQQGPGPNIVHYGRGLEHNPFGSLQPTPPPGHPRDRMLMGGREGERAGAAWSENA